MSKSTPKDKDNEINLKAISVLIVDLNEFSRSFTRNICRVFGFGEIIDSKDTTEALKILSTRIIDLVICDWVLSPLSGEEFIRKVRASQQTPNYTSPIVVLTGVGAVEMIMKAREAGMNDFLVRPIALSKMVSRLDAAIRYPQPFIKVPRYVGPCRRRRSVPYTGTERRSGSMQNQMYPDNLKKISDKIKSPGGMSVDDMMAAGKWIIAEESAKYSGIRRQDISDLFALIRALKEPGNDVKDTLNKIYIKANDIKGLGQTFGFPLLTTTGELLCNLLYDLPPAAVKTLFVLQAIETHATVIKMVIDSDIKDENDELAVELVDGLRALVIKAAEKKLSGVF